MTDLADIQADMKVINHKQCEMHGDIDKILVILQGNGDSENGLVVKVALLRQSVGRLWKVIGSIPIIIGLAFGAIKLFL